MKTIKYLLAVVLLFYTTILFAQAIFIPYSMGFEESDSLELKSWVLNSGANAAKCEDQWVVGGATYNEGRQSLYISNNNGVDAQFGQKPNVQYAYRDFTVEGGHYELDFDYRCMGSVNAKLYVGLTYANNVQAAMNAQNTSGAISPTILAACNVKGVYGSSKWLHHSMSFNAKSGVQYRLFFMWASTNKDSLAIPLGACIDNIQMTTADCRKPTNLTAEARNDSVFISWSGTSEQYVLERRKRGTDRWFTYTGLTKKSLILEGLSEGTYDFRVRGVCVGENDTVMSAYDYLNAFLVYYPDRHCIDYVHLDNPSIRATIGTYANPYAQDSTLVLGEGASDRYARHAVNVDPDALDPRTANGLRLIPEGSLASVRLGNWSVGGEAESLSFEFLVDTLDAAIVLIKYAVVLEDPDHPAADQPRFTLEVLDSDGNSIGGTCGSADFRADAKAEGWHVTGTGSNVVVWKEWTTLGLNLQEMGLAGQKVIIRFTTYDCDWGGHYGYAYFTMDCAAAKIKSNSCGNDSIMSVTAPQGFDCEWYDKNDNLVATTPTFSVDPADTTTYRCHLSFKEDKSCYFDLYTVVSNPRFPAAEFAYKWEPANCENRVRFTNKSHIIAGVGDNKKHYYNEKSDEYQWDFGNGQQSSDENPIIIYPTTGGVFPVTLFTSIADGRCTHDTTVYITIPAIGDTRQSLDTAICQGNYIVWGDKYSDKAFYAAADSTYTVTWKSVAGCDSTWVLNLTTNPTSTEFLGDTTVCAEVPLVVDDQPYKLTTSGKYYRFYQNQFGCDSTVWMNVTMQDSILPTVTIKEPEDEPGSGTITIGGKGYDYFYMNGERYDSTHTYFTGYDGGIFEFEFFNDFGCSITRSDTMNCECLQINAVDVNFVCVGDVEMMLSFVIDSGIPTTYTLLFDSAAHAVGFQDHIAQKYTKKEPLIKIPIPTTAMPNEYHAQLIFHNPLEQCEDLVFNMSLPLNFPSDLIFQRWGDVLSVYGTDYNGGYTFEGFQWFRDGQPIDGATRSYYYEEGGLDMDAEYQVQVTLPDGVKLYTCAFIPQPYNAPKSQPKKVIENQRLVIIIDGVRYNAQGNKIDKQ